MAEVTTEAKSSAPVVVDKGAAKPGHSGHHKRKEKLTGRQKAAIQIGPV